MYPLRYALENYYLLLSSFTCFIQINYCIRHTLIEIHEDIHCCTIIILSNIF